MFTSRAEYRLSLRADNADQRLTQKGIDIGCVSETRRKAFYEKSEKLSFARNRLQSVSVTPNQAAEAGVTVSQDGVRRNGLDLLAYPDINFASLLKLWPELDAVESDIARQIECDALYANYIDRQSSDIAALARDSAHVIPSAFRYDDIAGLSNELKSKLAKIQPGDLGQAGRIDGMTPAALTLILAKLRQFQRLKSA